jgi:hypothetical protein
MPNTSGRVIALPEFPSVSFVERAVVEPVEFIVCGGTREIRDSARARFAAAIVEFGGRFEDMVFHDCDDAQ